MFLRCNRRKKDGKEHRYWNIVESRRVPGGKSVQKQVLYLGEINDTQRRGWERTLELFEDGDQSRPCEAALFAEDAGEVISDHEVVRICLKDLELKRPRQWGGCWLACYLYELLDLDRFFEERIAPSRKGTRWDLILKLLVCYRLLDPGSEWRLHRHWFDNSAMADLMGEDESLTEIHKLYRCHDHLLAQREALFKHLRQRWEDLFNSTFDVLLYDLTSTYFESDVPSDQADKRRFGYSRDKRSDCVQIVIALIVTPEGFPVGYEVLPGNTRDTATLLPFLENIEKTYGAAKRIWVMDRGVPTEESLEIMRQKYPQTRYLVGTPKGRLNRYEKAFLDKPWQQVRDQLQVKLHAEDKEVYVLAQSHSRAKKEAGMRKRKLRKLLDTLKHLEDNPPASRDQLMMRLGAAKKDAGRCWNLVRIDTGKTGSEVRFSLDRDKLRQVIRREGCYLLRTNLNDENPEKLWKLYIQLTEVEEAFKNLKGDLALRPIHHQREDRIEAHVFISFLAYCLQVTLRQRLREYATGLTPRSAIEQLSTIQMLDVHLPTTDGRTVVMSRYTQPGKTVKILLEKLKLSLPEQAPPRIYSNEVKTPVV